MIGYRGFGDWLYAVPVLRYLFAEYDVHLETSCKGWDLFHDDTRFKSKTVFDVDSLYAAILQGQRLDEMQIVEERWKAVKDVVKPDKTVNLFRTLESNCVAEKWQNSFNLSADERRHIYGRKCWYEPAFEACGIPFPNNLDTTGLYYSDDNIQWVKQWREKHDGQFITMVPVSGSGFHKKYPFMKQLVFELVRKYKDAVVYIVGSELDNPGWEHERIYNACGNAPFKQTTLMVKYADLIIGPETGLHVAAGMWGTPKIQLCNMSNVTQLCGQHKNDYSIQSACECSPCHKMVQSVLDCDIVSIHDFKMSPACILQYDKNEIFANIEKIYEKSKDFAHDCN